LLIRGQGKARLPAQPLLLVDDGITPGLYLAAHAVVNFAGAGVHGIGKGAEFGLENGSGNCGLPPLAIAPKGGAPTGE